MATRRARILILCKTYPSPSSKYSETSCVAGMEDNGKLIRLYPVPFRLLTQDQKFKKWQWIEARVEKARDDHRPESHRIYVDDLVTGDEISARQNWLGRLEAITKLPVYDSFEALEAAREKDRISLGLLRPQRLVDLEVREEKGKVWTREELDKLMREQAQGNLFEETAGTLCLLQKMPFSFYYHYECEGPSGRQRHVHKIVDWEACQLFRKVWRSHGKERWQTPFRAKLLDEFSRRDLVFLMGNMHRHRHQWLIVSLIYPPRQPQQALF